MKLLIILMLTFCVGENLPPTQQAVPEPLKIGLKQGDAKAVSKFFNDKIELSIFDEGDIYPQKQAEKKLSDFFLKYRPHNFYIVFEGGKDISQYAIGKLQTNNGEFRVLLLLQNQKLLQLRIEANED